MTSGILFAARVWTKRKCHVLSQHLILYLVPTVMEVVAERIVNVAEKRGIDQIVQRL